MAMDLSAQGIGAARRGVVIERPIDWLHVFIVVSGLSASLLFVIVGLGSELQMYADGSIFSYAVAARDSWAFHWHNISGRVFVYLFCQVPAELYVKLTGDARGGIDVYGFLFFGAQLFSLIATYFADRSNARIIFLCGCFSVACVCPLVFGYPTELWVSHAVFWPTLAICHYARRGIVAFAIVIAALAALVLTYEGAVIFAVAIVCTLALRGLRSEEFLRGTIGFLIAMSIWALVKVTLRPDVFFSDIVAGLALGAINIGNLTSAVFVLLAGALASYAIVLCLLQRLQSAHAAFGAAASIGIMLAVYWLWFDDALHAGSRYQMRTAVLIATPLLGAIAAWQAVEADGGLNSPLRRLQPWVKMLRRGLTAPMIANALMLVMVIHIGETAKFAAAWTGYKAAVQRLAMGTAADPKLGDPHFVSAARIAISESRLSWASTTPFLSMLLAPAFAPQRLVIDPAANYIWFSCETARASEERESVIPVESRRLIRTYTCLYR